MSKVNKVALDKVLRSSFTEVSSDKKAFILLMNGKRIQTSSGKKIWGSSGAAKNALNNHVRNIHNNRNIYDGLDKDTTYDQQYKAFEMAEEAIKEWAKNNIQVVSIGEYETMQAKLKNK